VIGEQAFKLGGEMGEALRQAFRRVGLQLPIGEMGEPVAFGPDYPPAGGAEPGV
jgi:hypothetical protein